MEEAEFVALVEARYLKSDTKAVAPNQGATRV
jgi:hypothetical protein